MISIHPMLSCTECTIIKIHKFIYMDISDLITNIKNISLNRYVRKIWHVKNIVRSFVNKWLFQLAVDLISLDIVSVSTVCCEV